MTQAKRYAGDDWVFKLRYREKNGPGIDMSDITPSALLTNSKNLNQEIEITDSGKEDQTNADTKGRFWIKVDKDITKDLVYPIPPNHNFNTDIRRVQVKLRIRFTENGNTETFATFIFDAYRS